MFSGEAGMVSDTNIVTDTYQAISFEEFKSHLIDTTNEVSIDSLVMQILELKSSIDETKNVPAFEMEKNESAFKMIFPFLLLGLIILLFVLFIVGNNRREDGLKEDVVRIVQKSERLKNWRDESDARPRNQSTIQNIKSYDSEIHDLQRRIAAMEDLNKNTDQLPQQLQLMESPVLESKSTNKKTILYADFINDGWFSKVKEQPDDDTNFELHLNNESNASFTIYLPAYPRIVSNPAAFLQGCEKQVIGSTAVSITDVGTTVKDDNGKWRITDVLKVEIR
jgi:hypothetical protein